MKPVIGLEVHIEVNTKSKMFCSCRADHFGAKPNTYVCPICLGLPGSLPFTNWQAVEKTIKLGLALNCEVSKEAKFDRKHYFYPDLPKAYQISQYDAPFCVNGRWSAVNGQIVRVRRVHLEEDTAKLIHADVKGKKTTLIDFNRSGVPLIELVTEPDFSSVTQVVSFLKEIQTLVRYLEVSDADMEKGSMRLEANVSVSKAGEMPEYKVELKNINSFKFLEKAIDEELRRQTSLHERSEKVTQETRGFDSESGRTFAQRGKEEAQDYRYFPEPDIPPVIITREAVDKVSEELPRLPQERLNEFKDQGIKESYAFILTRDSVRADYFESALTLARKHGLSISMIADLMVNKNFDREFPEPELMVKKLVEISKRSYAALGEVEKAVDEVVGKEPKAVTDYQAGKGEAIGFFIGRVQKKLKGKGEISLITKKLKEKLNQHD